MFSTKFFVLHISNETLRLVAAEDLAANISEAGPIMVCPVRAELDEYIPGLLTALQPVEGEEYDPEDPQIEHCEDLISEICEAAPELPEYYASLG